MIKYLIIFICCCSFTVHSADSILTLKQQLDRLHREVDDISKIIFSTNNENTNTQLNNNDLTALDLRIYDLEKDIKRLNFNIEEIIFQLDDLLNSNSNLIDDLETRIIFLDKRIENLEFE